MHPKSLVYLAAAVLVFTVAAVVVDQESPGFSHSDGGALLFPDFAGRINDASKVVVETAGTKFTILRHGDDWVVADKYDFPAKYDVVKGTLVGLAQLRTIDQKTSQPSLYPRLQVEDPGAKDSKSAEITVEDGKGAVLASLILGKSREPRGGESSATEIYVRKPGDAQSWLVTGTLQRTDDVKSWMQRNLVALDQGRVHTVAVTPAPDEAKEEVAKAEAAKAAAAKTETAKPEIAKPETAKPATAKPATAKPATGKAKHGKPDAKETAKPEPIPLDPAFTLTKDKPGDGDFTLQNVTATEKVKSAYDVNQIAGALASLVADDVLPAKDLKPEATLLRSLEYRSFDGAVIDLQLYRQDGKIWVKLAASVDPKVAAEAMEKKPTDAKPASAPSADASAKLEPPAPIATNGVAKDMADLTARTKDWVYTLDGSDLSTLEKKFSDLVEDKDAAAPKS